MAMQGTLPLVAQLMVGKYTRENMLFYQNVMVSSADLEVQLIQQNHCDGVLSKDWNTLLGQQISQNTAISMSKSALVVTFLAKEFFSW